MVRLLRGGQCGPASWAPRPLVLRGRCVKSCVLCWLCLIAVRKALLLSDLTAISAFPTAVALASVDKRILWLRVDVCVARSC